MQKSREVEEQYLNLRSKVEGRIKELQGKMQGEGFPNRGHISPPPRPVSHHCHHHHCHGHCNHTGQFAYPPVTLTHSSYRIEQHKQNSKSSANDLISQALAESLKNQRQINDHIKAINDKIQTLSVQHSVHHNRSSYLSEEFSVISKNKIKSPKNTNLVTVQHEKERCHSEVRTQSPVSKYNPKNSYRLAMHHFNKKKKEVSNIQSIHADRKLKKQKKTKSKSHSKRKSQYFLSFGCPVHSPQKASFVSPQKKQIYKDAQHRTRKHEKTHLLEAFNQQTKSRKNLIDKISQKAFNQYGRH